MVVRTFDELLADTRLRLRSVERRLAIVGGGGSGGGGQSGFPPLPAPIRYADGAVHTVAATAWGTTLPGTTPQSMTVAAPLWVLVTFGAWLVASAGETRAGVSLGGATVVSPPSFQQGGQVGSGAWGQTLLTAVADSGTASAQRSQQRMYLLAPGTTTFTIEAYLATAGTHNANYPVLEVIPIAYDGSSGPPVRTVQGALTRRTMSTNIAIAGAGTDQTLTWDTPVASSGHFSFVSPGTFRCEIPGTYNLHLSVGATQGTSAAGWLKASLLVNGALLAEAPQDRDTPGGRAIDVSSTVVLRVGDLVTGIMASRFQEGSINAVPSRTFIELVPVTIDMNTSTVPVAPRIATGSATVTGSLAPATHADVPITFPAGLFTDAPYLSALCNNGRATISVPLGTLTKDGAVLGVDNWSTGTMPAGATLRWTAIQA
jgi:hypothetical protein